MITKSILIVGLISILPIGMQSCDIGDGCTVLKTKAAGTYTTVNSCEDANNDLRADRSPTYCVLENSMLAACCPNLEVYNFTRISQRKCAEYASTVHMKCSHRYLPLVEEGVAEINEFPHMALLGYGYDEKNTIWYYGGTLISELFVLTLASLKQLDGEIVTYVRLGQIDRSFENSELYNVKRFIAHPYYKDIESYNDIALIELYREVSFKPNIRPACLPKFVNEPVKNLIATGWGSREFSSEQSFRLKKIILEKFSYEECQPHYKELIDLPDGIDTRTHICAGSRKHDIGTCQGDSGGPLQIHHYSWSCMYTVIGITSFGLLCGEANAPEVFTQVGPYLDWIEDIVWRGR